MPRDKIELAKEALDANNRRDVDRLFAELVTPDFVWESAMEGALDGGAFRGREGVERFAAATSDHWEDLQNTVEEFRDLGDRVLVLGRLTGRGKASGAPVDQLYAGIVDFRGDRISRYRAFFDRAEGLRVAGLSE